MTDVFSRIGTYIDMHERSVAKSLNGCYEAMTAPSSRDPLLAGVLHDHAEAGHGRTLEVLDRREALLNDRTRPPSGAVTLL